MTETHESESLMDQRRSTRSRPLEGTRRRVDAAEFLRLALSNRKLWRLDDTQVGQRGLFDPTTGERIMTEHEQLDRLMAEGSG